MELHYVRIRGRGCVAEPEIKQWGAARRHSHSGGQARLLERHGCASQCALLPRPRRKLLGRCVHLQCSPLGYQGGICSVCVRASTTPLSARGLRATMETGALAQGPPCSPPKGPRQSLLTSYQKASSWIISRTFSGIFSCSGLLLAFLTGLGKRRGCPQELSQV